MSFIRKKITKSGKAYAYEITALWDSEKQQSRSTSKYIGSYDENGNIILKGTRKVTPLKQRHNAPQAKLIQDFGDGFLVLESIKQSVIYAPLESVLSKKPELLSLMSYRLASPGPMHNCALWAEGNVAGSSGQKSKLSSQDISRLLTMLGEEALQREFFKQYLSNSNFGTKNIIIDATSLPCQNSSDFNAFGYSDGGIEQQFRFHCVLSQATKKPLFYRYVPGNIEDISTLKTTIEELKSLGVEHSFALLDAGYCSEENIKHLRENHIDFLMRLPAGRVLYKEIIEKHHSELEVLSNAVQYGKRSLFVKAHKIDLYGKEGYIYIILDPAKKTKDYEKLIRSRAQSPKEIDPKADDFAFKRAGVFTLISSKEIHQQEVLSSYYNRQSIEQVFGFAKSDLDLLPIRCHSDQTIRGYLFLQFLLLIVFIEIRERLSSHFTVEQALMVTRSLKCKIYDDKMMIQELTKNQKKIFELAGIIVPKTIVGI
ncbi:MAG: transposase [Rickettsiaceae bacterium]|nr:transposase [Rickettsiaceae bacterium]